MVTYKALFTFISDSPRMWLIRTHYLTKICSIFTFLHLVMFLQLSHHYSDMKLETKNITLWRTCCGADQGQISSIHRKKIENLAVLSFDFSHLTVNICMFMFSAGSEFFSPAEPDPDPWKKMLDPHPCLYQMVTQNMLRT